MWAKASYQQHQLLAQKRFFCQQLVEAHCWIRNHRFQLAKIYALGYVNQLDPGNLIISVSDMKKKDIKN